MTREKKNSFIQIWRIAALVCVFHGLAGPAPAQDVERGTEAAGNAEAPSPPAELASPRATLETFINAMRAESPDYERALTCMDMTGIPDESRQELAVKLYGTLIRLERIDFQEHPNGRLARSADLTSYDFFPRSRDTLGRATPATRQRHERLRSLLGPSAKIALVRNEQDAWLFSAETVAGIDAIYDSLIAAGEQIVSEAFRDERELSTTLRLESRLPEWARDKVVGLKYWQWIGLLALIFLGVILDFSVRFWLRVASRRTIIRRGGEVDSATLRRTVRPFGLAVMALFWLWVIRYLGLPLAASKVLMPAVQFFVTLSVVWAAYRLADLGSEVASSKAARTETRFDDLLIPLIRKTVKIFITVFGLIYIADSLSIPILPLLTGLGIGGVGFAFAAKDTLEHLFGSVTVIADRPFQVGDWVVIGDTEGTVEEVGFRSTRVRTFYNSLVTVPNGNLVRAVVDNYGKRKYRRWSTHLNVTYDTPPEKIEAFCEGIRELVRLHPYTRKDYYQIWLHQFAPSSLDVLLYVFWETPDWQTELRERHRLMMDILRLADRLGVEFAFPTQTLHMYREDHGGEHEPAEVPEKEADFSAQRSGRGAAREVTANAAWKDRKPPPYRFRRAGETIDEDEIEESQIESKIGGDA